MNDSAPRLCRHWLHGLSSKVQASIDGCVMHDNRIELRAAFGRFFKIDRVRRVAYW
jgi:hypothetical protein